MEYSIKKGITKGLLSLLSIAGAFLVLAGFSDTSIWELIVKYIQPLVGSLTVGGAITVLLNYVKVKSNNV